VHAVRSSVLIGANLHAKLSACFCYKNKVVAEVAALFKTWVNYEWFLAVDGFVVEDQTRPQVSRFSCLSDQVASSSHQRRNQVAVVGNHIKLETQFFRGASSFYRCLQRCLKLRLFFFNQISSQGKWLDITHHLQLNINTCLIHQRTTFWVRSKTAQNVGRA